MDVKTLVAQMSDHELEEAIIAKEDKLRLLFPEDWTPYAQINPLALMFNFKLHGLDWRSEPDFIRVCVTMHKLRIIEFTPDQTKIRRAPHIVNLH